LESVKFKSNIWQGTLCLIRYLPSLHKNLEVKKKRGSIRAEWRWTMKFFKPWLVSMSWYRNTLHRTL